MKEFEYENCPIIEIETLIGTQIKIVHYLGYFYDSGKNDTDLPLKFNGLINAVYYLTNALIDGKGLITKYLFEKEEKSNQFVSYCSFKNASDFISDAKEIDETKINDNIEDGKYIIFTASKKL